jgi:hypothetical protein
MLIIRKNIIEDDKDLREKDEILNQLLASKSFQHLKYTIFRNNSKIKKAIDLFPDMISFVNLTLEKIRMEFSLFRKDLEYATEIDLVGAEAFSKGIKDIFKISYLSKEVLNSNMTLISDKYKHKEDADISYSFNNSISQGKEKYVGIIHYKNILKERYRITKETNQV